MPIHGAASEEGGEVSEDRGGGCVDLVGEVVTIE